MQVPAHPWDEWCRNLPERRPRTAFQSSVLPPLSRHHVTAKLCQANQQSSSGTAAVVTHNSLRKRPWASAHIYQPQQCSTPDGDHAAPTPSSSSGRRLRRLVRRVGRDVRLARGARLPAEVEGVPPEKQQTQHIEVPRRRRGRRHARGVRRAGPSIDVRGTPPPKRHRRGAPTQARARATSASASVGT